MDNKKREKLILTIGIIVFVIMGYFGLFVLPTVTSINRNRKALQSNEESIKEIKTLLEEYEKYNSNKTQSFEGSLSSLIEQKAREMGITIAYIKPYGEDGRGAELKIDEIDGKKLLELLYTIESEGIQIDRLNIRDYKGSGLWVLTMSLES
ncbi:MAG: type II secretion system protein GspM [Vulcanimicrobiota bacterium]